MRRALGTLGVLLLACAIAFGGPAASGASSSARTAVKPKPKCEHRAKHHRRHHHKRCRRGKTGAVDGTTTGGAVGSQRPGGTSGPPGRLLATEREVSATQLQLQLSRPSLSAGTAIVEQYNAGSDPHNLILEKAGQVAFSFESLDPGGDARQTVTLTHGTWTLYCSLLNHRSLGMQATLTVN
jgi:plastocyanin